LEPITVVYACILQVATHWPYDPAGYLRHMLRTDRPPSDKTLHFVAYAILAGLFWACARLRGLSSTRAAFVVMTVVAVWAALDEVTQPFFNRCAEPLDWIYDMVGAAIGCAVVSLLAPMVAHGSRSS
jgi:VanZ family protein